MAKGEKPQRPSRNESNTEVPITTSMHNIRQNMAERETC